MSASPRLEGRFSVLGIARSGIAAANALVGRGYRVLASDLRSEGELAGSLAQLDSRVEVVTGENRVRDGDTVIISPGVRPGSPAHRAAHERGRAVWSDVELFWRLSPAPMLAVTGTDGKSTTTALLGEMATLAGCPTFVGGNIGVPLCRALDYLTLEHLVVAEISCFQLIHCPTLRPRVAVYTNISQDHIDYHGSFEAYQAAKRLLMANLGPDETVVFNALDTQMKRWQWPEAPSKLPYARGDRPARHGLWIEDGDLIAAPPGSEPVKVVSTAEVCLPGAHNLENALAATGAALSHGLPLPAVRRALKEFAGLEHRLEFVLRHEGVAYYNDSKATNPNAAVVGLTALVAKRPRRLVIIAGGSEKGSDFSEFAQQVARHASGAVLIGETGPRLRETLLTTLGERTSFPIETAGDMHEAVARSHTLATPDGVVALCPACASFDRFTDFEDRGRCFKEAVRRLVRTKMRQG